MKLALMLLLFASPLAAQRLDPDWCWTCQDSFQHFGSTAALDLGAHALFPKWKPWQRVLLTGVVIGGTWEVAQADVAHSLGHEGYPGFGFSVKDLACDVLGAMAGELLVKALR